MADLKNYSVMVPVLIELDVLTHLSPENLLAAVMKQFSSGGDPFLGCPLAVDNREFAARTRGVEMFGGRAYLKQ